MASIWDDFIKSVETSFSDATSAVGEMAQGNFNNLGNTLLRGMYIPGMSQEQKRSAFGETGKERKQREAAAKTDQEGAAVNAALEAKRIAGISAIFEQMATSRANAPGRAATMLTGLGKGATLLTPGGNY